MMIIMILNFCIKICSSEEYYYNYSLKLQYIVSMLQIDLYLFDAKQKYLVTVLVGLILTTVNSILTLHSHYLKYCNPKYDE